VVRPEKSELPTFWFVAVAARRTNDLDRLRRVVRECHRCLVQQGFPAMLRHSVTLGRVWWHKTGHSRLASGCCQESRRHRRSDPRPRVVQPGRGGVAGACQWAPDRKFFLLLFWTTRIAPHRGSRFAVLRLVILPQRRSVEEGSPALTPSKRTSTPQSDAEHEFSKARIGAEAAHAWSVYHPGAKTVRPGISRGQDMH
jgi:hypothetical protein